MAKRDANTEIPLVAYSIVGQAPWNKGATSPAAPRFWAKVEKTDTCWLWVGARSSHGYGGFNPTHRTTVRAHRFAWQLTYGEIPAGLFVCHRCDTPLCVRPDHLFLGSAAENTHDMVRKGRVALGERVATAKLTREAAEAIRTACVPFVVTRKEVARRFGVSKATVDAILSGRIWKAEAP